MKRIRVAMIAPPWLPIPPDGYGGIENVLAVLVPSLMKLGVEVELFTVGESTIKPTKKHWLYKERQYSSIHLPHYHALPTLSSHILFSLNYILKDGKFDVVHDHNPYIGPSMLAYADKGLPPLLHTLHGPPFTSEEELRLGTPDNMQMWRQLGVSKKLYYVGISKALMKSAPRSLHKQTLPPIYNGIDVSLVPFVEKKSDYFVTLARFHPDKGQLLAVMACLKDGHHLRMAGTVGDLTRPRQIMMELANPLSLYRSLADFRYFSDHIFPYLSDQIEYVGEITGQPKMKFLSHAKALLFPVQWEEPFGMAPIEALACGTPVVAMARGALPEIIQHGVNGFLVHNSRELRYYMKRVDQIDPADCRRSVEQNFSASSMAQKYLKAYKTILR